mgnify:FL=1
MIKKNKNNKGLTLIEILISIIITSVMVAAMYTSYNVVSGAYKQVSDKAKISGSSRDLVTMIMRDIRMAGFRYYAGEHAAQEFLNNPLNATCVASGLRLTERNYISFNTGFDGDEVNSHAPLVIRKNVAKDAPSLHNPFDTCCDSIEIIYEDFSLLTEQDQFQPYKIFKISYYAAQIDKDNDKRYGVYKKVQSWVQPREAAYELGICNWPGREEDLVMGFWDDDCPECYEDLVRDHVVDMEFIPFDENGRIITDPAKNFPAPENLNLRDRLFDIRTVDMRLTFRSKNEFYKDNKQIDPSNPSNRVARKIYGLQRNFTPTDDKLDKYLRDSVIVTVNTRNIGQAFQ